MSSNNPIDLLFGGMSKLAPGGDEYTRQVLHRLPARQREVILDVGCGAGRQTLVLASELGVSIDAIDLYQPFLDALVDRVRGTELESLVRVHCVSMDRLPERFSSVDLLWSEGAAYSIGFENALRTWARAMTPGSHVVVSELSWLEPPQPGEALDFFASAYPAMQTVDANMEIARSSGYEVLETYALPRVAWTAGFYDELEARAARLMDHVDADVRAAAAEMQREIDVFHSAGDAYGYVFYSLEMPPLAES